MADDLQFTFDTSAFDNAMKKVSEQLSRLPSVAETAVKKTGSPFKRAAMKIGEGLKKGIKKIPKITKGIFEKLKKNFQKAKEGAGDMAKSLAAGLQQLALKLTVVMLAFQGIKKVLNQMPEVGQAFGIAKDVFLRNLLFPLRKAVFPMLQRLVDWVRDNRLMFIKWGQTLANIFQTIVKKVELIINVGKKLTGAFLSFVNDVFGTQVNSLTELFNILTFKFALILEFIRSQSGAIMEFLEPIIETLKIGLAGAFESATAFVLGFLDAIVGIDKPLANIANNMKKFTENLFDSEKAGENLQSIFENLGGLLGKTLTIIAEMTDSILEGLLPTITEMQKPINDILTAFTDILDVLFDGDDTMKGWKKTAEIFGKILGGAILLPLKVLAFTMKGIAKTLELLDVLLTKLFENPKVKELFEKTIELSLSAKEGVGDFFKKNIDFEKGLSDAQKFFDDKLNVEDAIITKDGRIIETNPNDNIIATKNNISLVPGKDKPVDFPFHTATNNTTSETTKESKQVIINIDMSGFQQVFNEASPENIGQAAETLVDELERVFNREFVFKGG